MYQLFPKGGKSYYLPVLQEYLDRLLVVLREEKTTATFLTLGIMAREYPQVIRQIAAAGHEIGCHSDRHQLIHRMNRSEFLEDTRRAVGSLEDCIGKRVRQYRAPAFSISRSTIWALDVLAECGIEVDSSIFPARRRRGGFPGFQAHGPCWVQLPNGRRIKEMPINFWPSPLGHVMFSGGGYFRFFPYGVTRRLFERSSYAIAYFHLRDFDAKQKRVISPRYPISYFGIRSAFGKFERLMRDFAFLSMGVAENEIDWSKVPVVELDSATIN